MIENINKLRRVELALIQNDRKMLCEAVKLAKVYVKSVKTEPLARHWMQLINKMEKAMSCTDAVASEVLELKNHKSRQNRFK